MRSNNGQAKPQKLTAISAAAAATFRKRIFSEMLEKGSMFCRKVWENFNYRLLKDKMEGLVIKVLESL